ncbi:MAG TPA: molecular chaperone DnaK, partial [Rhodocyclaceae bacterium]|nr:molecular chaperone DnaK [Rhodocyclaceae bacterium]
EDAIKSGDKAAIDAKSEALATVSQKLGEKVYAQAQAEAAAGGAGAGAGAGSSGAKASDADVVDAEFTEVKDKK